MPFTLGRLPMGIVACMSVLDNQPYRQLHRRGGVYGMAAGWNVKRFLRPMGYNLALTQQACSRAQDSSLLSLPSSFQQTAGVVEVHCIEVRLPSVEAERPKHLGRTLVLSLHNP